MASWFTRALDRITPWDRGGEVDRRKKREEEQAQRFQSQRPQVPTPTVNQPSQSQEASQSSRIPTPSIDVGLVKTINNRVNVPKSEYDGEAKRIELEELTNKYRDEALAQKKKQTSWFDRQFTDRGWNKQAEVAARSRAARDFQEKYGYNRDPVVSKFTKEAADEIGKPEVSKVIAPVLSVGRVGTGIAQGAAGTYDLLTPGKGQNRFTQSTTRKAEEIDRLADDMGIRDAYRTVNVPLEIASYFTPGVVSKGGKVSNILGKGATKVDDVLRLAENPTRTRKFISEASKELLDARNVALDARLNARYLGQDSARGKEITPKVLVENAVQSIAGAFLSPLLRGVTRLGRGGTDEAIDAATSATAGTPGIVRELEHLLSEADIEDINKVNIPISEESSGIGEIVKNRVDVPNDYSDIDTPAFMRREPAPKPTPQDIYSAQQSAQRGEGNIFKDMQDKGLNPGDPNDIPAYMRKNADAEIESAQKAIDDIDTQLSKMPEQQTIEEYKFSQKQKLAEDIRKNPSKKDALVALYNRRMKNIENLNGVEDYRTQLAVQRAEQQRIIDNANLVKDKISAPKTEVPDNIPVVDKTEVPAGLPEQPGKVRATTATAPAKTQAEIVARQPVTAPVQNNVEQGAPGAPVKAVDNRVEVPEPSIDESYERLLKSLRENQQAQRVEKKLNKAEKARRDKEKTAIYNELVASGVSRGEAEKRSMAALRGKYLDNTVANFDVTSKEAEAFRKAIDENVERSWDRTNTKSAFEHLIDPERTDPIQPWERTRIRQFVQKALGEDAAQSLDEAIVLSQQSGDRSIAGRIADFMTSAIAAGDISAVGRQGLSGLINHPRMSKRAWDDALGALLSPQKLDEFTARLSNDADTAFIQENMGGKYLTLADVADEARGPDTANKAISWYVDPSNRHYNVYLDSLRHAQKKAIIERYGGQEGFLRAAQEANPEDPSKWMKAWNRVIDAQSGRGSFSKAGSPTAGDMQILFSARNLASKFQRLTAPLQLGLLKTNPSAYVYQLRETGTQAAVLLGTLAAINESGIAEIENGKIKIGNTRVDITGGFSTIYKTLKDIYQAFTEEPDSSIDRTPWGIGQDFLQNQLAPTIGMLAKFADVRRGGDGFFGFEDKYGNPVDAKWLAQAAPLPAVAQTIIDNNVEGESFLEGARNVALDAIGFNTNTYKSSEDKDKEARAKTADQVNPQLQKLRDTGLLSEGMVKELPKDVQKALSDGKPLKQEEVDSIKSQLVEGVGAGTGADSDTAYRERGEYDKDIAALKLKKEVLESQPNPKPSDLKALDVQIKRSELLSKNKIPFDLLEAYQTTGVEEWRDLEEENPELFQKLWEIDELMAKNEVSYKSGSFTENKYYQKAAKGKGRGGSRGGSSYKLSTDIGKLTGSGSNAPKVREYATLEQSTGVVPRIKKVQPNIVHAIREGRV